MSSSYVWDDEEGPVGPLTFVFFSLLTFRLGMGSVFSSVPTASVQLAPEAVPEFLGKAGFIGHTHPIPRGLPGLVAMGTAEREPATR